MDEHTSPEQSERSDRTTRRSSLVKAGGTVAALLATGGWRAAASESATDDSTSSVGPAAVASGLVSCVLAPEQTEGPYYVEGDKVRRNITEGKPGVPLMLRLTVVDVSTCKPIKNAAVDIWHCDSGGVYSGTDVQQTATLTFLRGIQKTDAKGVTTFRTIYPGWYTGRTVHIHVKVALGGNVVHTGQLYFPDPLTDSVYKRGPYRRRPNRDMRNAADSIYRNGGKRSTLTLTKNGSGYVGTITMGVQRS
jgi:protocatechuate 3,4-dioxygenase beta subunit